MQVLHVAVSLVGVVVVMSAYDAGSPRGSVSLVGVVVVMSVRMMQVLHVAVRASLVGVVVVMSVRMMQVLHVAVRRWWECLQTMRMHWKRPWDWVTLLV